MNIFEMMLLLTGITVIGVGLVAFVRAARFLKSSKNN